MYQLFCHLGYMNTIPAYFLSCIGKSENKKNSFSKFRNYIRNKKILDILKKSEFIRHNWHKVNKHKQFFIPQWVIKKLGVNYLDECIYLFNYIINKIKNY